MELTRFTTEISVKLDLRESARFLEYLAGLDRLAKASLPLRVARIHPGDNPADSTFPVHLDFELEIDSAGVPEGAFSEGYRALLSALGIMTA